MEEGSRAGFVGKEGGGRCGVGCWTYRVAAHGSDDGLADGGEQGPALEELAPENLRDYQEYSARGREKHERHHSHSLSFISLMSAPATPHSRQTRGVPAPTDPVRTHQRMPARCP